MKLPPAADTIAAVATPPGKGGIGIIRVSGTRSAEIAERITGGKKLPVRQACFTRFRGADGEVLDEGIALRFEAPASFTGEDTLEIQVHSSPVMLGLILQRLVDLGARLAQPGEFSRRAFENGKYDLSQVEAVAALVNSATEQAARSAVRSLRGEFSEDVGSLIDELRRIRIELEAAIDFSDEDITLIQGEQVAARLQLVLERFAELKKRAAQGARLSAGTEIVIVGAPNAGKSSLLNRLAGRDEAIVSDVAGTTRDVVKSEFVVGGMMAQVLDTAGLCRPADNVEEEGIRRAYEAVRRSDLTLVVIDAGADTTEIDARLLDVLEQSGTPRLKLFNKADLVADRCAVDEDSLWVSAKTGEGIDGLRAKLADAFGISDGGEHAVAARRRHLVALDEAERAVARAAAHRAPELVAEELRRAQTALGSITGEYTTEDLLSGIFSQFCIGK